MATVIVVRYQLLPPTDVPTDVPIAYHLEVRASYTANLVHVSRTKTFFAHQSVFSLFLDSLSSLCQHPHLWYRKC